MKYSSTLKSNPPGLLRFIFKSANFNSGSTSEVQHETAKIVLTQTSRNEVSIVDVVYLLVSLSVILLVGAIWGILWAVKSDQFEDLEGPAKRIILDDRELTRKHHD